MADASVKIVQPEEVAITWLERRCSIPRIPAYRQRILPSANVGAAPISTQAANVAGGAVGQGLAALGRGVGDIGQTLFKIDQANNKSKDISASVEYDEILKSADLEYEASKLKDADPNRFAEYRRISDENAATKIAQLQYGTSNAKDLDLLKFSAWSNTSKKLAIVEAASVNIKAAELDSEKAYIKNPTPENLTRYEEAIKSTTHPDLRDDKILEVTQRGEANLLQNQIIIDPFVAEEIINEKIKSGNSPLTKTELNKLKGYAVDQQKINTLEFESSINEELVAIDNAPDMSQVDFDAKAEDIKQLIVASNIDGTKKKKMLADLERWRRGTSDIDYAKVLSLNQEMDAAQRSGVVDPTIENRIKQASLEGAFGGRNKGGQKIYGDMIRRFGKLQFDERLQAIQPIVREVESWLRGEPGLQLLFHEAKNKLIAEHPEWSTRELFIQIEALGQAYEVMSPEAEQAALRGPISDNATVDEKVEELRRRGVPEEDIQAALEKDKE